MNITFDDRERPDLNKNQTTLIHKLQSQLDNLGHKTRVEYDTLYNKIEIYFDEKLRNNKRFKIEQSISDLGYKNFSVWSKV